jgi:hypothetical protein
MYTTKKLYKKVVRKRKMQYGLEQRNAVYELRKKDPRAFWKHVKSKKAKPTHPDIALDEFYAFFKELSDMNGAFEDRDLESSLQGVDENVVEPNVDEYLDASHYSRRDYACCKEVEK